MHPDVDQTRSAGSMREKMIFFDTVYNPIMTQMLKLSQETRGEDRGRCRDVRRPGGGTIQDLHGC